MEKKKQQQVRALGRGEPDTRRDDEAGDSHQQVHGAEDCREEAVRRRGHGGNSLFSGAGRSRALWRVRNEACRGWVGSREPRPGEDAGRTVYHAGRTALPPR